MNDIKDVFVGLSSSTLMSCGQPIGAMVAGKSETADVIRKAECGITGGVAGIKSAILRLKEDASVREAMGSNGRRYLEVNMILEKNVAFHEEIFCALAGGGALVRRAVSSRARVRQGLGVMGCNAVKEGVIRWVPAGYL